MTQKLAFVIGDIHGMYNNLQVMLSHWRREEEKLIMVGDYIDRGPNSAQVLYCLRDLQQEQNIILLRGNHEEMFLYFLRQPHKHWDIYRKNGGLSTVAQILERSEEEISRVHPVNLARLIRQKEPWLFAWLEDLRYYTSFGQHIIVHAGLDLSKADWRHTSLHDFVWIRKPFHEAPNHLNRPIIFGHTPVQSLHNSNKPWNQDNKWGIDGGIVFGGSLIGLRINQEEVYDQIIIR